MPMLMINRPEPPFQIGTENAAREGWRAFFEGKQRNECPFPRVRGDLKDEYERGWDAAEQWKPDFVDNYTILTAEKRERLEMLIEEASEVIKLGTKILRNGYDNHHPDEAEDETNRKKIGEEILDFFTVAERMIFHQDIPHVNFFSSGKVWKRKLRWTRFQPRFSDPLNRKDDDPNSEITTSRR